MLHQIEWNTSVIVEDAITTDSVGWVVCVT